MATVTPNYNWPVPTSTDFVKDGASSIEALGDAIDATVFGLPTGALTLVSATTIGSAVSSVNVTSAFSADYDAYKIVISGGVASTATFIEMTMTGSTASYAWTFVNNAWNSATLTTNHSASYPSWLYSAVGTTDTLYMNAELVNPFLTKYTQINSSTASNTNGGRFTGIHQVATSYTGFTLTPSSGTLTGGTIYVYGYGV
jgi:hypothetical protein